MVSASGNAKNNLTSIRHPRQFEKTPAPPKWQHGCETVCTERTELVADRSKCAEFEAINEPDHNGSDLDRASVYDLDAQSHPVSVHRGHGRALRDISVPSGVHGAKWPIGTPVFKAHAVKPSIVFSNELYRNRQLITASANAIDPTKAGYQLLDQTVRELIVRISHRTLLSNGIAHTHSRSQIAHGQ